MLNTDADLDQLVDMAAGFKNEEQRASNMRKEIEKVIRERIQRGEGNTQKLYGLRYVAKISLKIDRKYDQAKIEALRAKLPEDEFLKLFGYEWQPLSKKAIDAAAAFSPYKEDVKATFIEKEASPYFQYELLEE
jgi:hypothetical protein